MKKLLLQIIDNQNEIKKRLDPRMKDKAERLDEIIRDLNNIHFTAKCVYPKFDESGEEYIEVSYEAPKQKVYVNGDASAFFASMNRLNLLSLKEQARIAKILQQLKK